MCRSTRRPSARGTLAWVGVIWLSACLAAGGCARQADLPPGEQTARAEPAGDAADAADAEEARESIPSQGADATPDAGSDASASDAAGGEAQRAGQFGRLAPPDPEQFPGLERLSPEFDVWTDPQNKRVVLRGGVCLREGPIELFACIHQWVPDELAEGGVVRRGTKEYESIVTIHTTAAAIHAALLAIGAEPGSPVRFAPEYEPAHGTRIDVLLHWEDEDGKPQEAPAQDWIRNVQTGEPMEHSWVFAGSGFRVNEANGQQRYLGEEGNLICVSNFPDAVMDVPIQSSSSNEALLFEAFTERIPPVGTPVTVVLQPQGSGEEAPLQ